MKDSSILFLEAVKKQVMPIIDNAGNVTMKKDNFISRVKVVYSDEKDDKGKPKSAVVTLTLI